MAFGVCGMSENLAESKISGPAKHASRLFAVCDLSLTA
jgi:hypothetical protein